MTKKELNALRANKCVMQMHECHNGISLQTKFVICFSLNGGEITELYALLKEAADSGNRIAKDLAAFMENAAFNARIGLKF